MGRVFALLLVLSVAVPLQADEAIFAGGCFWCTEADFEKLDGVTAAVSGYIGGGAATANYRDVITGNTGHYEAVRITYDPEVVSYRELVDFFWGTVDVRDDGGQFCDRGPQYRSAVFVSDASEREQAEASKLAAEALLGESILTPIIELAAFFEAEAYHQDYYRKNPVRYRAYR